MGEGLKVRTATVKDHPVYQFVTVHDGAWRSGVPHSGDTSIAGNTSLNAPTHCHGSLGTTAFELGQEYPELSPGSEFYPGA